MKNKNLFSVVFLICFIVFSCNKENKTEINNESNNLEVTNNTNNKTDSTYNFKESDNFIQLSLPDWVTETELIPNNTILYKYAIQTNLNPFYLEEDFNGDNIKDIILPIKDIKTNKSGFAIIHGKTNKIFIVGAGSDTVNLIADDLSYVDGWKINRDTENTGFDIDSKGELYEASHLINTPSIYIFVAEVGGGLIYWDGKEYKYLHQVY